VCFAARRADAVFVGRVTAFTSDVQFDVELAFSGVKTGRVTLEAGWGTCGYNFTIGNRYIVYAWRNRSTGALATSICTRTRPLSDPHTRADLAYFARGKQHRDEPLLTGVVSDVTVDLAAPGAVSRPLAGIKVTATPLDGGARARTATTRADGSYELADIGTGRFSVTATLPPQFEPPRPVTVKIDDLFSEKLVVIRACAEADVWARIDGRISGQLLDERNEPLRDVTIHLANPAHARAAMPRLRTIDAVTDMHGHYEFRYVGPGEYVVGVDLHTFPRPGALNKRRFYGESLDPAAATVVKLKTAERRRLPPFRLLPLPADRLITVVVYAPTNDVARETTIFLTGARREPVAHTGDPLSLRLPFGASYLVEAVAPKGYRVIQPPDMRIAPDDMDKTIEFRVEKP
jgi:hypothetical protein